MQARNLPDAPDAAADAPLVALLDEPLDVGALDVLLPHAATSSASAAIAEVARTVRLTVTST
jgi:hypothetical protein